MRLLLPAFVLVALLLSGCYHEERAGPDSYRLDGVLVEGYTQEDEADLRQRAAQRDAQVSIAQDRGFRIEAMIISECENLQLELAHLDYVASVGECRRLL